VKLFRWLNPDNWKRGIALIILWAYGYQLAVWGPLSWIVLLIGHFTERDIPVPMIVPWEQLMAGTATLATVGGIETWRERRKADGTPVADHSPSV